MRRFELTGEQYTRIEDLSPGKPSDPSTIARANRLFMDAVPRTARTDTSWADLTERFGKDDSTYQRFNRRARSVSPSRVMEAMGNDADLEDLLPLSGPIGTPRGPGRKRDRR